ncbi:MAG: hydroxysqualene dehydroxylase HpnE [Rhodobacterales bacterium]|nr:hydroxysqualene dehydroxylase HpnE [Rhodobacterales bacterium]
MTGRVHIIGAGLAGLSCGVRLAERGVPVTLYESAQHAGGRCRSFHDEAMGCRIDNGNHLMMSGNRATMDYLDLIGAQGTLAGPARAEFPFLDTVSGRRWTVRPNAGPIPWWILVHGRRVPRASVQSYLQGIRFLFAGKNHTVADCLDMHTILFRRFWEPFVVAALNADPEEASARLMAPVVMETFARGEKACRPRLVREGLSESLIDPALDYIQRHGGLVQMGARLRGLNMDGDRIGALDIAGQDPVALGPGDAVVLAVPPAPAADLVPGLTVPRGNRAIVNAHFRLDGPPKEPTLMGIIGRTAQWIFQRGNVVSVTVSAADLLAEETNEEIANRIWPEVTRIIGLGQAPLPAHRVVKEKRATFAQIPSEVQRRPGTVTNWSNLYLAGDWTDTGLPATIEGAIRSGAKAAGLAMPA